MLGNIRINENTSKNISKWWAHYIKNPPAPLSAYDGPIKLWTHQPLVGHHIINQSVYDGPIRLWTHHTFIFLWLGHYIINPLAPSKFPSKKIHFIPQFRIRFKIVINITMSVCRLWRDIIFCKKTGFVD